MSAKKSQEESEQPAKVYQLDAIQSEVGGLKTQMTEGFKAINENIQALLLKSNTQVTPQQLADNISALGKTFDDKLKESEAKIHLTYGPTKKNIGWIGKGIAGQAIVICGGIILFFLLKGST